MQHHAVHQPHPKRRWKWPWIVGALALLAGVGAGFVFGGREARPEEITVTRGTVVEIVSVTGRVTPASRVDLAFERSGKVARVRATVGDRVAAGATLVELAAEDVRAELREAEAQVATERANVDALVRGTRPEEIAVKEAELAKAEQDLANAYTAALVAIEDAYTKADDAIRAKTDPLFTNDDTASPTLTFLVSDSEVQLGVTDLRRSAGATLVIWGAKLREVRVLATPAAIVGAVAEADAHLALARDFLARALDAVNASAGLSAATVDSYKTAIAAGRTNVAGATTAVSTAAQNLAAQTLTVARVRSELALARAGTTSEELAAARAKLLQAEARRDAAAAALTKTVILAPFAGLVTKQEAKVGAIVAASTALVGLIAENSLEIEAFIPEVDIGKVNVADRAAVTLDAYGDRELFHAAVVRIEPAETVVEGVATYKTILHFVDSDPDAMVGADNQNAQERARSGMTANLEIESARHKNVLAVPFRALREKNGGWFAYFAGSDGALAERAVTIGLRGTDGSVEVTGGLSENDRIVAAPPRE